MLKIELHGHRQWTFRYFPVRITTPHGLIFSPHENPLSLLYVLLWVNKTKLLPFSQAENYWDTSAPLTAAFLPVWSLLRVPSCYFRMRSSHHQLPPDLMPLPPDPRSKPVFASIQPRNFVTRIAFLLSRSDLVPSSLCSLWCIFL